MKKRTTVIFSLSVFFLIALGAVYYFIFTNQADERGLATKGDNSIEKSHSLTVSSLDPTMVPPTDSENGNTDSTKNDDQNKFNNIQKSCSSENGISQEVGCLLAEGTKAIDSNIDLAMKLLRLGIEKLGTSYHDDDVIDDTSQKLGLADIEYSRGNFVTSVNLYKNVLESRLDLNNKRND